MIEIELVQTNFFTRWPCTACGGVTEKDIILCEGESEDMTVRVCPRCLKSEDIDATLEERACALEEYVSEIRALKGNLSLPTYEQWQAETKRVEDEWAST